jgi:hypothetical protein
MGAATTSRSVRRSGSVGPVRSLRTAMIGPAAAQASAQSPPGPSGACKHPPLTGPALAAACCSARQQAATRIRSASAIAQHRASRAGRRRACLWAKALVQCPRCRPSPRRQGDHPTRGAGGRKAIARTATAARRSVIRRNRRRGARRACATHSWSGKARAPEFSSSCPARFLTTCERSRRSGRLVRWSSLERGPRRSQLISDPVVAGRVVSADAAALPLVRLADVAREQRERRLNDDRLLGMGPSKTYWRGRRWWRHWDL